MTWAPRLSGAATRRWRCATEAASPKDLESVHAVRRALRRLRYALECFGPRLTVPKSVLRVLKTAQDHLGALNDHDVAIATLSPLLKDLPAGPPNSALLEYIDILQQSIVTSLDTVEPVIAGLVALEFQAELAELLTTL